MKCAVKRRKGYGEPMAILRKPTVAPAQADIDDCPGIAQGFRIKGVPTVMVFKGGQVKGQHVGVTNKETLLKLLES